MLFNNNEIERLKRNGFCFKRSGTHCARTMMFEELSQVLTYVNDIHAKNDVYIKAIEEDNCLGKRSSRTRHLTCRHLIDLYLLDPSNVLFRGLLFFWNREIVARPIIALLCTYARDPVFRSCAPFILNSPEGTIVSPESLEKFIDQLEPGRFSPATLRSTARNVNATWTVSGHLQGKVKKMRVHPVASPGSVSYALLLGYLAGLRGIALFQTECAKLLDCSLGDALDFAEEASRRGWISMKRIENIVDVQFPNIIHSNESGTHE